METWYKNISKIHNDTLNFQNFKKKKKNLYKKKLKKFIWILKNQSIYLKLKKNSLNKLFIGQSFF